MWVFFKKKAMKKLLIILFTVFIFISWFTLDESKGYEVEYRVELKNSPSENSKPRSSAILKVREQIDNLRLILKSSGQRGVFKVLEEMSISHNDRLMKRIALSALNLNSDFYSSVASNESIRVKEFDGVKYGIKSQMSDIQWNLTSEKKVVSGYTCYKALTTTKFTDRKGQTSNIEIIAWYAPTLSLPFGPKNYGGLPGLILELHEGEDRISYYVEKILLDKKITDKELSMPKVDRVVSEQEYLNIVNNISTKFDNYLKKN